MAHQIENKAMFYVGKKPWHGIGQRLENPPTVEEGIRAAGLDWNVLLYRLQTPNGKPVNAFATVRGVDEKVLGVVGPRYVPLQNRDAFKFFNLFLEAKQAQLHTAGSLCGGRKVWVLAHVSGSATEIVKGDRVDSFILLSNGHDGTTSVRVGFTPIRVVCANTLSAAHRDKASSKLLRVRHTASVHDTLEKIREVMDVARSEFAATVEQYRALASREVNQADLKRYVRQVLEVDPDNEKEDSPQLRNTLADILKRAEQGMGNDMPGVRGTLWAAYNGVTESLSHRLTSNTDRRLNSLWFSTGAQINRRALEIALGMAS